MNGIHLPERSDLILHFSTTQVTIECLFALSFWTSHIQPNVNDIISTRLVCSPIDLKLFRYRRWTRSSISKLKHKLFAYDTKDSFYFTWYFHTGYGIYFISFIFFLSIQNQLPIFKKEQYLTRKVNLINSSIEKKSSNLKKIQWSSDATEFSPRIGKLFSQFFFVFNLNDAEM